MGFFSRITKSLGDTLGDTFNEIKNYEASAFSISSERAAHERQLREYRALADVFRKYKELPRGDVLLCPVGIEPQPAQIAALRAQGRAAVRMNMAKLAQNRESKERAYALRREMTGDYGILSHLDTLMDSARRGQETKWEVYRDYFLAGMEELKKRRDLIAEQAEQLRNKNDREALPQSLMELAELLEEQMQELSKPEECSQYERLYDKLRVFPLRGEGESLESWYARAAKLLKAGLETLDGELREELYSDYPALGLAGRLRDDG